LPIFPAIFFGIALLWGYSAGTHFNMDQIALPVQLRWDVPNVESTKRWSLLDQLMPLYSCAQKYTNYDSPTMGIMPELYVSLAIIPKQVTQSRRKRGVLIELLELEDSDEKCVPQSFLC
jgi:hypothetical protein